MLTQGLDRIDVTYFGDTAQTVGNVTSDNTYWPYANPYFYTWPSTPTQCGGYVHVWACEHTTKCKCGKAERQAPKCSGCGK
jgi:hypothetical protein